MLTQEENYVSCSVGKTPDVVWARRLLLHLQFTMINSEVQAEKRSRSMRKRERYYEGPFKSCLWMGVETHSLGE